MNSFYWDIVLCIFTYGMMAYLSIRLMKSSRDKRQGGNDGGLNKSTDPKIDLPPGVVWPTGPDKMYDKQELVV